MAIPVGCRKFPFAIDVAIAAIPKSGILPSHRNLIAVEILHQSRNHLKDVPNQRRTDSYNLGYHDDIHMKGCQHISDRGVLAGKNRKPCLGHICSRKLLWVILLLQQRRTNPFLNVKHRFHCPVAVAVFI